MIELIGSVIVSITQSILFYGKEIGISMVLFEILCNGIMYYILYRKNKIQNKTGIWLMIPILLLSSTYFIFANRTFYFANICIIMLLNFVMYSILTNPKGALTDDLYRTLELIEETITDYREGIDLTQQKTKESILKNPNISKENLRKIAISFLIIFVVVGIVLFLLASADTIFANLFSGIGKLFSNINIGTTFDFLLKIFIIAIVYVLFLSLTLKLQKEQKKKREKAKEGKEKYNFTVKLLLISLNIVYFVFCVIQIQSLFGKVTMNEALDYANYARTGFFQLMVVSFINLGVILVSSRCNEKNEKIIKLLNVPLVLFTIVIAISSMYRMYMYEMEYGLTYLRTFVYILLSTEIVAFLPITIYIFKKNFDFMKWCFAIIICAYCITNYMNLEKIIVYKNLNRDNTTQAIDYPYIQNIISADSYNILQERLTKEDLASREKLDILNSIIKITSKTQDLDWQEFNISKYQMKKKDIKIEQLEEEIEKIKAQIKEEEKIREILSKESENYIYNEAINENETYLVEQTEAIMGTAIWKISKLTDHGKKYHIINTIEVTTPSKIKFFENGLGFIEKPINVYCGKADLWITHDSGKSFEMIEFPEGEFTLSNPERRKMEELL